jgi:tetratricopeptide (TPR) repeat protein
MLTERLLIIFAFVLLVTGCATTPRHPEELEPGEQDQKILRDGFRWLENHPDDLQARILIGNAAWRLGRHEQAWKIWNADGERIMGVDVRLGQLMVEYALDTGQLQRAEELLAVPAPAENDAEQHRREQELATLKSRKHGAIDAVYRGDKALRQGDMQRAQQFYRRAVEANPLPEYRARLLALNSWVIVTTSGMLADREATDNLNHALELWPGEPVLYLDLVTSRILQNNSRVKSSRNRLLQRREGQKWLEAIPEP